MGSYEKFVKSLFGVVVLAGFMSLIILVGMLESEELESKREMIRRYDWQGDDYKISLNDRKMLGEEKYSGVGSKSDVDHHDLMLSKRSVPNRSDPIHNRRAGNSRRPPGHA